MSRLSKFKINKDAVKKSFSEENGREQDPRRIPLFKLDHKKPKGETLVGVILPDPNGLLIQTTHEVGPYATVYDAKKKKDVRIKGVKNIGCTGDNTSLIVEKKFELYADAKDYPKDSTEYKQLREAAKAINEKTTRTVNFLVMESPFELPQQKDGNMVYTVDLPAAVYKEIKKNLDNGDIEYDELADFPVKITRTTNPDNGRPSYEMSTIRRKPLTEEELEFFEDEDLVIEPHDLTKLGYFADLPESEEEEKAWLDENLPRIRAALGHEGFEDVSENAPETNTGNSSGKMDKKSLADKLNNSVNQENQSPADDPDSSKPDPERDAGPEAEPEVEQEQKEEEETPKTSTSKSDLLAKLKRVKK